MTLKWASSFLALLLLFAACKRDQTATELPEKSLSKKTAHELTYENVSVLIEDMQRFAKALRPLDRSAVGAIDNQYKGVYFEIRQKPLFLNVYPDPENNRVVFLIVPKDPATGSTYLFKYEKNLPVVNTDTLEVQIRMQYTEEPLTCLLTVQDPAAYIAEVQSHLFTVRYKLYKRFMQSGTFDFDGLTIPTYRTRGYPFIVFDLAETELTDTTLKVSCSCRQI